MLAALFLRYSLRSTLALLRGLRGALKIAVKVSRASPDTLKSLSRITMLRCSMRLGFKKQGRRYYSYKDAFKLLTVELVKTRKYTPIKLAMSRLE